VQRYKLIDNCQYFRLKKLLYLSGVMRTIVIF
jgi:hypothetical protein